MEVGVYRWGAKSIGDIGRMFVQVLFATPMALSPLMNRVAAIAVCVRDPALNRTFSMSKSKETERGNVTATGGKHCTFSSKIYTLASWDRVAPLNLH
jgi:hypothetical protein